MTVIMKTHVILFAAVFMAAGGFAGDAVFQHSVKSGKKPWTSEKFLNNPREFSFAIIPDRTGSERPGKFQQAIRCVNMLRPEFVMTVGDQVQGLMDEKKQTPEELRRQWDELQNMLGKLKMPLFLVVGNHDINRSRKNFERVNEISREVWKEYAGESYYCFIYRDVLFLCLNQQEGRDSRPVQCGITQTQLKWALNVLEKNADVRWTLVFIHSPGEWRNPEFREIEKALQKRNYTVFSGDKHRYTKYRRYGRDYYVLATAGGTSELRGADYGEFDHITWVTMTDKGPEVANILLDGVLPGDVVTEENSKYPVIKRNIP